MPKATSDSALAAQPQLATLLACCTLRPNSVTETITPNAAAV